jgi:spore coat protein SA
MKPKICLIPPYKLPVPAVKGGAVETLVQIFAEENETEQLVDLIIFSIHDSFAIHETVHLKNVKFIFIECYFFERIIDFVKRVFNRIGRIVFKRTDIFFTSYYRKCLNNAKRENLSFVIAESGGFLQFKFFLNDFRKEQLYAHLHGHYRPMPEELDIFGGIIGVSKFVTNEYLKYVKNSNTRANIIINCINERVFKKRITKDENEKLKVDLGIKVTDFVVLYFGRIVAVKGVR